jgi:hypothetical protein
MSSALITRADLRQLCTMFSRSCASKNEISADSSPASVRTRNGAFSPRSRLQRFVPERLGAANHVLEPGGVADLPSHPGLALIRIERVDRAEAEIVAKADDAIEPAGLPHRLAQIVHRVGAEDDVSCRQHRRT